MTSAGLGAISAPITPTMLRAAERQALVERDAQAARFRGHRRAAVPGRQPRRHGRDRQLLLHRRQRRQRLQRRERRVALAAQFDEPAQQRGRRLQPDLRSGRPHRLLELQAGHRRQHGRVLQRGGHRVFAQPQPARDRTVARPQVHRVVGVEIRRPRIRDGPSPDRRFRAVARAPMAAKNRVTCARVRMKRSSCSDDSTTPLMSPPVRSPRSKTVRPDPGPDCNHGAAPRSPWALDPVVDGPACGAVTGA